MWLGLIFGGAKTAKKTGAASAFKKIIMWMLAGSCASYFLLGILIILGIIAAILILSDGPLSFLTG